jgi:hypothetical protein
MKLYKIARKYGSRVAVVGAGMLAVSAHAALDAAVTAAVTAAQTDLTALYNLLTTAGAALFVVGIIYRRFFKIK